MDDMLLFAQAEAKRRGIDPDLVMRVINAESGGRADAVSNKGARGYMQLMPGTAKDLGVNINDPQDNIRGGVQYLAQQLKSFGGDVPKALAAYNAGPGNVRKYGGVPPFAETQAYVNKITGGNIPIQKATAKAPKSGDELFADLLGPDTSLQPAQRQAQPVKQAPSGDELFADLLSDKPASSVQPVAAKRKGLPATGGGNVQIEAPGVLASIGRGMVDIGEGGKQLYNKISPFVSKKEADAYDKQISEEAKLYEKGRGKEAGTDWARMGGTTAAVAPAFFLPGMQGIAGQTLIGAITSALMPIDTQREGADYWAEKRGQATTGAAFGGGGAGAAKLIGKSLKPVSTAPDAGRQAGIDAAERLGLTLTAGQKTGSLGLQQVESVLSRTPGAAGLAKKIADKNAELLNLAGAKSIGLPADQAYGTLSEASLGAAKNNLGGMFKEAVKGVDVPLSNNFFDSLAAVDSKNRSLGAFMNPQVDDLVTKGLAMAAEGKVTGPAYQTIRSTLSKRASDAFRSGNSDLGQALKAVRDGLDEAAKGALTPEKKAMFNLAQEQYGNFKTLIKGNVIKEGNLNPALARNAMMQFNPTTFKTGLGNSTMKDIAKVGESFGNKISNSGTPERTIMQNMMFGNPLTGLPIVGGSYVMQKALQAPITQKYLTRGLLDLTPAEQQGLMRAGGLLGAGMGRETQR